IAVLPDAWRRWRAVCLTIRSHQVANHSLIAGFPAACFALEERERIVIQRKRHLGLPARVARKLIDRRQLVPNAMQLADDFSLVVCISSGSFFIKLFAFAPISGPDDSKA